MSNKNIDKKLEFAFNHYDHCGEFDFYGNKIIVFRRCGYEDYKTGEYIEGDESVAAFVNDEYIAGWYYQDEDDLENAMSDAVDWIFENKEIEIEYKACGTIDSDALKAKRGIKSNITEGMQKIVKEMCGEKFVSTVNILNIEKNTLYDECKFIATFKGNKTPFLIIRNKSWADFNYFTKGTCIDEGDIEFAKDSDKELYESMFTYKQDWL